MFIAIRLDDHVLIVPDTVNLDDAAQVYMTKHQIPDDAYFSSPVEAAFNQENADHWDEDFQDYPEDESFEDFLTANHEAQLIEFDLEFDR